MPCDQRVAPWRWARAKYAPAVGDKRKWAPPSTSRRRWRPLSCLAEAPAACWARRRRRAVAPRCVKSACKHVAEILYAFYGWRWAHALSQFLALALRREAAWRFLPATMRQYFGEQLVMTIITNEVLRRPSLNNISSHHSALGEAMAGGEKAKICGSSRTLSTASRGPAINRPGD